MCLFFNQNNECTYPILTDLLCSPGTFSCGSLCLSLLKFCDGFQDCLDGTDEPLGCSI